MTGMNTSNMDVLIRAEIWSNQLKDTLQDMLEATKYVRWIDFPDGTTMTIPSIGDMDAYNYTEDTAIEYTPMDTGEFQFTINEYLAAATYITNKARQDSYKSAELEAAFLPKQLRAIMVAVEGHILATGQPGTTNGDTQTAADLNNINGAAHRWVGSDTTGGQQTIGPKDFAKARYSLKMANVPLSNLIAIVDPAFEYYFNTQAGFLDVSYNPMWEGIVSTGVGDTTGMRFSRNIYGFDVYTSNYLPSGFSETIDSVASGAGAVAALFFSAQKDVSPWIGAWRQQPKVDAEYNKDLQREEYATTARYDTALYRPENLITVLGQTDIVF